MKQIEINSKQFPPTPVALTKMQEKIAKTTLSMMEVGDIFYFTKRIYARNDLITLAHRIQYERIRNQQIDPFSITVDTNISFMEDWRVTRI